MAQIEKNTLPHGLLFQGPKGIGKATLAYHLARYLLSTKRTSFPVPETDPIFPVISQMRHPDFLLLGENSPHREDEKSEITIDEVRQVSRFIHLSPQEGGWRVVLIDAIDDLNRKAMNALLKALEEPPPRTVMVLISHFSGGLLPTIRSRCQRISFHPLEEEHSDKVLQHLLPSLSEEDFAFYRNFSEGCPGRSQSLFWLGGRSFYLKFLELLEDLSQGRLMKAFPFLETLSETSEFLTSSQAQRIFIEILSSWIHRMIQGKANVLLSDEEKIMKGLFSKHPLATWLDIWSSINSLWHETEVLHLNRKSAFLTVFGWISGHVPLTKFRESA